MKPSYASVVKGTKDIISLRLPEVSEKLCNKKDCLSGGSPDLLAHICTYLDTVQLMQVIRVSKLFKKTVCEKTPIIISFNHDFFSDSIKFLNRVFKLVDRFTPSEI